MADADASGSGPRTWSPISPFPAAPVVEGTAPARGPSVSEFGDRRTLSDVPRGLHGTDPGSTAHDVVGEGIDGDSSERMRSAFNEIDPTEHGHRSSSSRRNGANPQN